MLKKFHFAILSLLALSVPAYSEDCSRALIQDKLEWSQDIAKNLAILSIIDEETYNKHKRDFTGQGTIPIKGIPVNFGSSYSNFDEERNRLRSEFNFKYDHDESVSYSRQVLSNNAVKAYISCLDSSSRTNPGFYAWMSYADEEDVAVTLYWNPVGNGEPTDYNVILLNGGKANDLPTQVQPHKKTSFSVVRETGKPLKLLIEGAGYGPYKLLLVGEPTIQLPCYLQSDNDTVTLLRHDGAVSQGICKTCPGSSCEDRSYNTFSPVNVDLACIKSIETTSTRLIKGFDCSWTPYGPMLQNMIVGPTNQRVEIAEADCSKLVKIGKELGLDLSTSFCR